MKFSLDWLKQYLETGASAAEIAAKLNALGIEVEGLENPAEKLAGFRVAKVLTRGAASQRRQAAGTHRRYRRRRAVAGRLWRSERPPGSGRRPRHGRRCGAGGRLRAQEERDPRGREQRHDVLDARARARRRPRGHYRAAGGRARWRRFRRLSRGQPGVRRGDHAEPARLHGRLRHRPRSGGGRDGHAEGAELRSGCRHIRLPGRDPHRRSRGLPGVLRPGDPRGEERSLARMAAGRAAWRRPAADLGAGRPDHII